MRVAAVSAHASARTVTQRGQGPPALQGGARRADGKRQARHPVAARRCCDYCGGQTNPRCLDRASRDCLSRRRGRGGRKASGSPVDGIGKRERKNRASDSQRTSEGAHKIDVAAGLHRASTRSRDLGPDDVRKKSRAAGNPATELEERHEEVSCRGRRHARKTRRNAARQSCREQVVADASRRARRRAGDHSLSSLTIRSRQLAGRADARNRPQESDSRADGRPRPS